MDFNERRSQIGRQVKKQKRMAFGTTADAVTVGSREMSRQEKVGGVTATLSTYSIATPGGNVAQTNKPLFGDFSFKE